ncbi:MAG: tyrosine-type recombinase/integrase [Vicinamibacterales bacterium]
MRRSAPSAPASASCSRIDRRKVEPGIYKRRDGSWEFFVRVTPLPLKHRHVAATITQGDGATRPTTLKDVRDRRDALRRELERLAKHREAVTGSLAADVPTFLATLAGNKPLQDERRQQLQTWVAALGTHANRPRHAVPPDALQDVLTRWQADGCAYSTIHHRRTALNALYKTLDKRIPLAERPPNPVSDTAMPLKAPRPEPRGLPMPLVLEILAAVSDQGGVVKKGDPSKAKGMRGGRNDVSKTRIRIHVMAFTGMRHSELKRYRPEHWRRSTHELVIMAGKDCHPRVIALLPDAEHWLAQLEAEDATGDFNNGVVNRAFRRALAKVGLAPALPKGTWKRGQPRQRWRAVPGARHGHANPRGRTGLIRPYDLRHSILTWLTAVTGNTRATQHQGGHTTPVTTQRYDLNAVPALHRAAVDTLATALEQAKAAVTSSVTFAADRSGSERQPAAPNIEEIA